MSEPPGRNGHGSNGFEGLLAHVLGQRGAGDMLGRLRLEQMWPAVVGEQLARHTWPEGVAKGQLTIVVVNSTWHQTLKSMEARILSVVRARYPELGVESLRFLLGRPRTPPPEPEEPAEPGARELGAIVLTSATLRQLEEVAARIDDEGLRQRVLAAMVRHQQLRQWRLAHGWRVCPETGDLLPPEAEERR